MKEFKFGSEKVAFLFEGEKVEINMENAGEIMGDIGNLLSEASRDVSVMEKNVEKVKYLLGKILGEKSVERIFKGRKGSCDEVCALVNFVAGKIIDYAKERGAKNEEG